LAASIRRGQPSVSFHLNLLCFVVVFDGRSTNHGETITSQQIGGASLLVDDLVLYLLDGGKSGRRVDERPSGGAAALTGALVVRVEVAQFGLGTHQPTQIAAKNILLNYHSFQKIIGGIE